MQQYLVYDFRIVPMSEDVADILVALLGEQGFDSFEQTDTGLRAYIPQTSIPQEDKFMDSFIKNLQIADTTITYSQYILEQKDWNARWEEEGFRPIEIPGICRIHKPDTASTAAAPASSEGERNTAQRPEYDILLQPRMAFGSGTHETTSQLVEILLRRTLLGKRCLDMGTGTGILAICMALRGAKDVVGIDIDADSVDNARLNCGLNHVSADILLGDASAIEGLFDLIVANIHRNIIAADLPTYAAHLSAEGTLLCSGFFLEDVPMLVDAASRCGLALTLQQERNGWVVLQFQAAL